MYMLCMLLLLSLSRSFGKVEHADVAELQTEGDKGQVPLSPGLVATNFSNTRFHGDTDRAAKVYEGIKPLIGDDIADVAVYAANAPEHVQIAEVTILATHQASVSVIKRK